MKTSVCLKYFVNDCRFANIPTKIQIRTKHNYGVFLRVEINSVDMTMPVSTELISTLKKTL